MSSSKDEKLQLDMVKAAQTIRDNHLALIDYETTKAKVTRAKYVALVSEGFTESQAITLCQN